MPYTIKQVEDGYKVCKKNNKSKCFSKEGLPLERAKKQEKAIIISEMEGGLKPLTARVGGKVLLKKKIVDSYFPSSSSYTTYVEPFVGGGSVYFYKNKDDHKEVINDIDPDIITMFRGFKKYPSKQIANDVNGDYTQNDFEDLIESNPTSDYSKFLKTFLLYRLSYFGRGLKFGKPRINAKFTGYQDRLEGTNIYNTDYKDIIKKYNQPNTFFYLDPPARESSGNYRYSSIDIPELLKILRTIKGKFLLSLPDIDVKKKEFEGFKIITVPTKYVGVNTRGGQTEKVKEYLIMNYNPRMSGGTHKTNILKEYKLKDTGHSLEELSKVSAVPIHILEEVYDRGIGAYKTNPQSVRLKNSYVKNVKAPMNKKLSKEQWAMARVYSFLDGNPKHDNDLRKSGGADEEPKKSTTKGLVRELTLVEAYEKWFNRSERNRDLSFSDMISDLKIQLVKDDNIGVGIEDIIKMFRETGIIPSSMTLSDYNMNRDTRESINALAKSYGYVIVKPADKSFKTTSSGYDEFNRRNNREAKGRPSKRKRGGVKSCVGWFCPPTKTSAVAPEEPPAPKPQPRPHPYPDLPPFKPYSKPYPEEHRRENSTWITGEEQAQGVEKLIEEQDKKIKSGELKFPGSNYADMQDAVRYWRKFHPKPYQRKEKEPYQQNPFWIDLQNTREHVANAAVRYPGLIEDVLNQTRGYELHQGTFGPGKITEAMRSQGIVNDRFENPHDALQDSYDQYLREKEEKERVEEEEKKGLGRPSKKMKITKSTVCIPRDEFIREHKRLTKFFTEEAEDQGNELQEVMGGFCGGCMGMCGGAVSDFQIKLDKMGFSPEQYIKIARKVGQRLGYDPSKILFCNTGSNKLMYESPNGTVHFGNPDYPDFIIYSWLEHKGEVPSGTADKRRELYRKRATNIKGDWKKNKYSANNLAINILW